MVTTSLRKASYLSSFIRQHFKSLEPTDPKIIINFWNQSRSTSRHIHWVCQFSSSSRGRFLIEKIHVCIKIQVGRALKMRTFAFILLYLSFMDVIILYQESAHVLDGKKEAAVTSTAGFSRCRDQTHIKWSLKTKSISFGIREEFCILILAIKNG